MSLEIFITELVSHGDITRLVSHLALHNQADGQSDRRVIVQNWFGVHTVHNGVTGPAMSDAMSDAMSS